MAVSPVMSRIGLLLVVLLGIAACGLNPSGRTPTPAPSPLPEGVNQIQASPENPLAEGRYSDYLFEPRFNFEVEGDAWYAIQRVDGFFDIQQDVESPDVIAVQFARPQRLFGDDGPTTPTDAAHAVEILSSNPELEVVETDTSQIGGLDGSQVTFQNTGDAVARFMELPPGTIAINPERRLWVAFFDTDDGLLAVMIGGSIERWDDALAAAEPVLESIAFED